jgi:hypothetical protein
MREGTPMLRATLVIAALLIFSSAPLDAKHKRDRNRGNFFVQFSIGGGHRQQPKRFHGRYEDHRPFRNGFRSGGYYGDGYYGRGYYDSHRRHHKHKRFRHNKYKSRYYREHFHCPYH